MQDFVYQTEGVCATRIYLTVDNGRLIRARFEDGCDGNAQGICRLVEGIPVVEVIQRLKGISCDGKETSCPDQLAKALEEIIK